MVRVDIKFVGLAPVETFLVKAFYRESTTYLHLDFKGGKKAVIRLSNVLFYTVEDIKEES